MIGDENGSGSCDVAPNDDGEDGDKILIGHHADLLEEIARLEISSANESCCGENDLRSAVQRIGAPIPCQQLFCNGGTHANENANDGACAQPACIICNILDLRRKNSATLHYMGTMAQCRGAGGEALREAGALDVLLAVLWRLMTPLQMQKSDDCSPVSLLPKVKPGDEAKVAWFDNECLCNNHLHLRNSNPSFDGIALNALHMTALDLATSCLGSLRDLACGSAANRAAILAWSPSPAEKNDSHAIENGVHLLSAYVQRYDQCRWEQILSLKEMGSDTSGNAIAADAPTQTERGKKELRLLTNALGVVRNASHSTPDVCLEFFRRGLVDTLVWRLMPDDADTTTPATASSLPDASSPWREACFRSAGSLINLAEKCPAVARQLGSNRRLLYLLIEAWGGASAIAIDPNNTSTRGMPLLHLGLAATLHAARNGALEGGLEEGMVQVLERERTRKKAAQRQEEERKLRKAKQQDERVAVG
ncbi:hypothetical protein ACHAXT_004553 [Thalassiosira profunda]